jgi:CRP-like cAMP-binding protein
MGTRHRHAKQRITALRDLNIFSQCSQRQLRVIDQLGTAVRVRSNRVLCRQGTIAREAFVVASGLAAARRYDRFVAIVGKGRVIGDLVLGHSGLRHSVSIVAVSDMTLIVYNRAEFASLLDAADTVAEHVNRQITERLSVTAHVLLGECRARDRYDDVKITRAPRHEFESDAWSPQERSELYDESRPT